MLMLFGLDCSSDYFHTAEEMRMFLNAHLIISSCTTCEVEIHLLYDISALCHSKHLRSDNSYYPTQWLLFSIV